MIINTLQEYKKYYPVNTQLQNENSRETPSNDLKTTISVFNDAKNEYLAISNDIHSILSKNSDLTQRQKLDFCDNQRYFMKMYLKEVLIQINKV